MGSRFRIAAMEPGFVAHKTQIIEERKIANKLNDREAKLPAPPPTKKYVPSSIGMYSQKCSNCQADHLEETRRNRCSKCGTFLPKGIYIE
jgi:hypothetical protein